MLLVVLVAASGAFSLSRQMLNRHACVTTVTNLTFVVIDFC